jgi:CRP-like cAMP-binding protein/Fe-S-cluster-containing dehydrogenase component
MSAAPAPASTTPKMVHLTIDGKDVTVPEGTTIYDAAMTVGINVPILCHKPPLPQVGVCRVCCCEVKNKKPDGTIGPPERVYAAACMRTCSDNMVVTTTGDKRVDDARKTIVELLLSEHPQPCERHKEYHDCELEVLGEKLGITKPVFTPRVFSKGTDLSNPTIAIDHSACILCDRCVRACASVENDVIGRMGKGSLASISFDDNKPMGESSCVSCGECMISCPTGAITYAAGVTPHLPNGTALKVDELKQIPMFARISSNFLARSEGAVVRRNLKKGDILCRQGEFGSTAYYIESGKIDIYLETDLSHVKTKSNNGLFNRVKSFLLPREEDNREEERSLHFIPIDASVDLPWAKPLAQVGSGEIIGEAACLNFQPRSATCRAAEDTVVLEMLRNAFDILRRNRQFKAEMEQKYRQRALENHLRSVSVFRDLPADFIDYLRNRVQLVSFGPGEVICRQHDPADAFYLVRMGHVKVFETYSDGQSIVLSYLSRSQYFGEMGLLGGGERTASCTALDHVELVKIAKEDFDEMMNRFPGIKEKLQSVAEERAGANRNRSSMLKTVALPQYIDQGLYQAQSLLILDLEKCTRCDECVRACAQAHDGVSRLIREGLRYDKYLVTTSCRSCRDPYCMVGCPVGSIRRKNDLEIIIEDHCIGCGRCAEQCPYGNINMHPFEVTIKDHHTGQTHKEERRKAAVCDLCTDQCLDEDADPSCVYACPHDAAHRVDGKKFFEERLFGETITGEPAKI